MFSHEQISCKRGAAVVAHPSRIAPPLPAWLSGALLARHLLIPLPFLCLVDQSTINDRSPRTNVPSLHADGLGGGFGRGRKEEEEDKKELQQVPVFQEAEVVFSLDIDVRPRCSMCRPIDNYVRPSPLKPSRMLEHGGSSKRMCCAS